MKPKDVKKLCCHDNILNDTSIELKIYLHFLFSQKGKVQSGLLMASMLSSVKFCYKKIETFSLTANYSQFYELHFIGLRPRVLTMETKF